MTRPRRRPAKSDLERDAWARVYGLVMSRWEQVADACERVGLTPPQAMLLRQIEAGESYPMTALAGALACHASNVTVIVDRLEGEGLLRRKAASGDRRIKEVSLTPKGVAARRRLLERLYAPPEAFTELTVDELVALAALLKRLSPPTA